MTRVSPRTAAVRAGIDTDPAFGAVAPPIHLSTTYSFAGPGRPREYDYSRAGNPTRTVLAGALAELEGGAGAVVTSSGMAAAAVCLHAFAPSGATVVVPHDCYGGSWRLFDALARRGQYHLEVVDLTADGAAQRVREIGPDLLWIETPSNPLLRLSDVAALTDAAHEGAGVVVVDNTFCSPVLQRPLALGADVVVHSTTKYLNGHSDVVGGVAVAAVPALVEDLAWWANCLGVTGGAMDAYLTLRGLRTLHLRMRQHEENAARVVAAAVGHPAVAAVHYPGLPAHPGHELARRQQEGFGGILSIDLAGGPDAVDAFLTGLECFTLAESLGGVESLVCHPTTMTHAAMPLEVQAAAGLTPGLVRLSVGIEDPADLVADVVAGLGRAARVGTLSGPGARPGRRG